MPKYHLNECIVMKNCATSKWSHYITKSFWNMECFFKFHTPLISLVVLTPPIQPFIYRLCPLYKAIKTCLQQQHIINSELESLYYVLFIWNASTTNQSFLKNSINILNYQHFCEIFKFRDWLLTSSSRLIDHAKEAQQMLG